MSAAKSSSRALRVSHLPAGLLMTIVLVLGVGAVSAATLPSSLLETLLPRLEPAVRELPSFASDDTGEIPVAAMTVTESGTLAMGETDEETGTLPGSGQSRFRPSVASNTDEETGRAQPLTLSADPPLARTFPQDLDAEDGGSAGTIVAPSVSLALSGNARLPHLLQGSEAQEGEDAQRNVSPTVFSTTVFASAAPDSSIPQVVMGNGSSYQAVTVNNIASVVLSALQNITTTTIVNLTQTCGDGCTLGADIAANAGSTGGQDLNGAANANTTIGQDAEAQSSETNTSTQTSTGSTLPTP